MGRKRALRSALVAVAVAVVAPPSTLARIYCGGPGEEFDAAGIPEPEQWRRPHADALSTHCNGACASHELCVFRSSPQYNCAASASTAAAPECVRGPTCTYECIATTTVAEYPLRWAIEWTQGGVLVHTSATSTATPVIEDNATAVLLPREINRIDNMELPGNVIELVVRGNQTLMLEISPSATATYNSLVRLEITGVQVEYSWSALPHMANLKYLSLVNTSLSQWPLEEAVDVLSLESLDLRWNPGIRVGLNAFGAELRFLNLADCGLRILPEELTSLVLLRQLWLDWNPLTTTDLVFPPRLELLSLRGCDLDSVPSSLADMRQLTTLDLAKNQRIGQQPLSAGSLPFQNLLTLDVSDCGLTTFPFEVLPASPLRKLNLSQNPLSAASVAALSSVGALEQLDLSFTGLASVPTSIAAAASLQSINLAGNPIVRIPQWPTSTALETLNLSQMQLKTLPEDAPPSTLVALDLSLNSISRVSFPESSTLRRLNVSGNWNISVQSLPSSLESFVVSNCSLTAFPSATFNWSGLQLLDLSLNQLKTLDLPIAQGYSFEDLAPDRSLSKKQLDVDLHSNLFASFPSALLSLSPYIRSLDLRGNPFDPPLTLTPSQKAFLSGLGELRVDANALSTSCSGSARQTLPSGTIVCVGSSESPGTVQPSRDVTPDPDPSKRDDQSSDKPSGSGLATNLALGGGTFVLIAVGLVVAYRRGGFRRHRATEIHRAPARRGPSILSIPTAELPRSLKHKPLDVHLSSTSEADLAELLTSDSALPTLDVASACLLEDITDDLDFLSWRLRPHNVRLLEHVSTGPSCFIYRGLLNVVDAVPVHSRLVAVKKLPPHQTHNDTAAIERLAKEVRMLAPFQHPKIVQFFGVSWTQRLDLQIVLEWMPDADLRTLLAHHAVEVGLAPPDRWIEETRASETSGSSITSGSCRPGFSLRIALDIVDALVYLHSAGPHLIRQRRFWRLSSHKVLLDSFRNVAKLCDLGASPKDPLAIHHLRRWLSPETLKAEAHVDDAGSGVVAADIYAFGILLAELDTFTMPFHHVLASSTQPPPAASVFQNERSLMRVLVRGQVDDLRPLLLSESCPDAIAELVHWCTQPRPTQRPTATQIARALRDFEAEISGLRESSAVHTNRASEVIQAFRRTATTIYFD